MTAGRRGRYERLRTLASGGMATVYLGRMVGVGGFERLVAVKEMHAHLAKDPQFMSMFLDEARVAASIRHPNVVSVLDVEVNGDEIRLVMEYVEGPSLYQLTKSLVEEGQRFSLDIAVRIVMDALAGLHAAHELEAPGGAPLNLVHRDVSPQNILVGIDGQSRITDFGVAHGEARLQQTYSGQIKGKVGYMSPEQLTGGAVDRRSDVYSMGVVLWELLAGRRLFIADNEGALTLAAAQGAQVSPREVNPSVPRALDESCMLALRMAPALRYPTAAAFSDAIEDIAFRSGLRPASPRAVADLVQRFEEERPTQLRPDAAKAWMEQLGLIPSEKLEETASPGAGTPRARQTIPIDDDEEELPAGASHTVRMEWPASSSPVDLSEDDDGVTVMRTVRMDALSRAAPVPAAPVPAAPVPAAPVPAAPVPSAPVPSAHWAPRKSDPPTTSPNTSAGSLVVPTGGDELPAGVPRHGGGRWLAIGFAVICAGALGWVVRSWVVPPEGAPSPATGEPTPVPSATSVGSAPVEIAPPPVEEPSQSPVTATTAAASASASVEPALQPGTSNAKTVGPHKPWPPPLKKPPKGSDDTMIREVPF